MTTTERRARAADRHTRALTTCLRLTQEQDKPVAACSETAATKKFPWVRTIAMVGIFAIDLGVIAVVVLGAVS
jgi:hypothetical protein